jgi:hypothetical protein
MIEVSEVHLKSTEAAKSLVTDIRNQILEQYYNTNVITSSNKHWIEMVRDSNAHDPSLMIATASVTFSGNQPKIARSLQTEQAAIEMLKKMGQWESHKQECEKRFEESQNWARLMSLVALYESWEGSFRHSLLNQIDLKHQDFPSLGGELTLLHPVYGDLRIIRNEFLHRNGYFRSGDPKLKLPTIPNSFLLDEKMTVSREELSVARDLALNTGICEFPKGFIVAEKPRKKKA